MTVEFLGHVLCLDTLYRDQSRLFETWSYVLFGTCRSSLYAYHSPYKYDTGVVIPYSRHHPAFAVQTSDGENYSTVYNTRGVLAWPTNSVIMEAIVKLKRASILRDLCSNYDQLSHIYQYVI